MSEAIGGDQRQGVAGQATTGDALADVTVAADAAGQRVDTVAAALYPAHSRSRLQGWIGAGHLLVDGVARRPRDRLHGGERLSWALPGGTLEQLQAQDFREDALGILAEDLPTGIVHTDEAIHIVDKAADVVMHPAPGHPGGTLMNALLHHDPSLRTLPRAGIVHRLDRETSGLCVIARTPAAHTALVRQLQARRMGRRYLAVVIGEPADSGTVDRPIGRDPRDRKRMAVTHGGKPAVTHWRVLERFAGAALLDVQLETGRTHQIRVHLTALGHPLIGDPVYQDNRALSVTYRAGTPVRDLVDAFGRQALHATRLTLQHPQDAREVRFDSPMPPDMVTLCDALPSLR